MRRALLVLALCAIIVLLDVRPASARGCSNTATCSIPVVGFGQQSLLFNPDTQVQTAVRLNSPAYDTISNFTLQAWIYLGPDTLPRPTDRPIFFKGPFPQFGRNGGPTNAEFYLYVNGTNHVSFRMGDGNGAFGFDLRAPSRSMADVWTQVTVTVNSRTRTSRLYLDGSLVASQTWLTAGSGPYSDESMRVSGGIIQLGMYRETDGPTHRFSGRMDEIRVWNRALSSSELNAFVDKALVGDEQGLLSYHPLNEGKGATFESPWPTGALRLAPARIPTVLGTINPSDTLMWSSSELEINHPNTYYGQPGRSILSGSSVQFSLYGVVPSGATSPSNLIYYATALPAFGSLYFRGELIDESSEFGGNRSSPFPSLTYVPVSGFTGVDQMSYAAYYGLRDSQPITVTFTTGCRWLDSCNVCEGNGTCGGCLDSQKDVCGQCFGNGSTCTGCDNVLFSNATLDDCGVCAGNNRDKDACGQCFGNGTACRGCDGVAQPNPALRRIIDACSVCTLPSQANSTCRGCDGKVSFPPKIVDQCGICGGNNSKCLSGCDNRPNSKAIFDVCGVCGGDGSSCAGCDGVPQPNPALRVKFDECNVCGGNGSTCADCNGIPNGPTPRDVCGECGGNGTWCLDCAGCPFGDAKRDACGQCNGNNSTCLGCDNVPQPDPALRTKLDYCGDCGGNNSRCQHEWCNKTIPLSKFDACNVCNGDNSTCTCTTYRNRSVALLDCVLLEWTLSNTQTAIDRQLALLADTSRGLNLIELGGLNEFMSEQIRQLNSFASECSDTYCGTLSSVLAELADALSRPSASSKRRSPIHDVISSFGALSPLSSAAATTTH